ncbi:MAG: type II toxin-antitoxin system HicB family antitoxin [Syntrophorhabdus sp.]|jgi:predicted RNase H-like HicB family nuclease|nr:type II toxin-antitoxin system HicB family antitoxin [Syntrophorhabdus sp.]
MKSRELSFRVVFRPEPEGGYTATVPSLPGCISYGEDIKEAREMIKDAIKGYLESLQKHGEELPDDSDTVEAVLTLKYA